jgi:hypothetical protein
MGFQLGLLLLLLACVGIYLLIYAFLSGRMERHSYLSGMMDKREIPLLLLFFVCATAAILLTTTPAAAALWQRVPLLEVIQFPWRLLALATFTASALGGLAVWQLGEGSGLLRAEAERVEEAGILALLLLIGWASFGYSRPDALQAVEPWREDGRAIAQFEAEHPDMFGYTQAVEMPFSSSPMQGQYLAALASGEPFDADGLTRFVVIAGEGDVRETHSLGHAFGGVIEMAAPGTVQIQLLAFPGWRVMVDGRPVDYGVSPPFGLMEVDLEAGLHEVEVWMGLTPVRVAGVLISGLTLLTLVGLWGVGEYRRGTFGKSPGGSRGEV